MQKNYTMKKGLINFDGFSGLPTGLLQKTIDDANHAADHTSPVKVFSPEEIAMYETKQKGRKV